MLPQGTQKSLRAPMTDQEHDTGFFRLDEEGREIQRRQLQGLHYEKESDKATSVFAYATSSDRVIIVLSSIAAIIAGSLNPLLTIIYGQLVGVIQAFTNGTASGSELQSQISKYTLYYVYLALGVFTFVYATTVGFYYTGERITRRMRRAYLQAIIRQNMAFFDVLGAGEVTSRITSDMNTIQEGITSKISLSLTAAATFTTAFVIAFAEYWELALILTSVVVAISGAGYIGGKIAVKHNKRSLASYSNGATIAEEAIGSVRHVAAFGIQEKLAHRYHSHLLDAETSGVRSRIAIAIMISLMMAMPYMSYGLSYWQGSRYLVSGNISSGALVTITFAILIGAFTIGRVAPNTQAFVSSIASASMILKTISRQSPQDPLSHEGLVPEHVKGDIVLKGVDLVYPSRDDVMALDDVNITVEATKTTAIVGASGCGKSSIVGLIERFYEPTKGQLLLDGHDIQMLNLRWLRRYISYVGQEPMLFSTTIFENIRLGLKDIDQPPSTEHIKAMVENAAKSANVHEFITSLPKGYQTEVGEKGLQLSGGQRQRIAIARALVSNPKILLLDEATSALDSKSERMVQRALESAARGRTTIVIAHRLSTVRSSDKIVVMTKGRVVEQGHHDELLQTGGFYSRLVNMQQIQQDTNAKQSWLNEEDADDSENEKPSLSVAQQSDIAVDALTTTPTQTIEHPPGEAGQENAGKLSFWGTVSFILNLNSSEKLLLIIGLFCCIIAGLIIPVQSVFLAEVINVLALPASKYDQLRSDINFWCLMFLMISIVAFLAWAGHGICFSYSTEKLTLHARDQTFRTILRQNIAYFDEKEHSAGAMTALLSTSTTDLNAMNGAVSGNILTFTSVLLGGLILSLVIGWKLALVCTATIPFVAASGYLRLKMLALFDSKVRRTHQESATYASEVVTAIRTVASLSLENHVLDYYSGILDRAAAKSLSSILRASALYAASQSLTYLCAALGYWYGGTLIVSHEYSLLQFFICFAALITGSQIAGSVFSYAPDMSKAMHAARDLKALFQRQPSIDTWDTRGSRVDPEKCAGQIQFENVSFRYPTRTDRVVLENFSLSIEPGQHVALVGPSGCGKSTAISLLERFYDASSGCIRVDGQDISTLDVNDYRSMVSLVGQEPTIYQGTIKENIQLGSPDDVSEERIIQACKDANIYDTILSLPDGFSTVVGSRGNMLSGGQKQRIAIARALLRNTKILLLDEATSALDSASEKLVQDALDAATQHRTSVTVAHRLSTIQHADLICVLDQGRLVERGTHAELMAKRGAYSELVELQSLEEWAERVESGGPSATT